MRTKLKSHIIAVLGMFALSGCYHDSGDNDVLCNLGLPGCVRDPGAVVDDNAKVLGRDLGQRAALGENVDTRGALRGAAIRLGLDEPGRRRFAKIFWVQYERGYNSAGPYRLTPDGGDGGGGAL